MAQTDLEDKGVAEAVEEAQTPKLEQTAQGSDVWYDSDGNPTDRATAEKAADEAGRTWQYDDKESALVEVPDDEEEEKSLKAAEEAYQDEEDAYGQWLSEHPKETAEQRKKREKAERANRIIASIGDAGAAVANLIATSQYAPNARYESLEGRMREEYDKGKAEREAIADKHLNYALQMGKLRENKAQSVREIQKYYQSVRDARERAEREAEKHQWERDKQPYEEAEAKAKAKYWETNAGIKEVDLNHEADLKQSQINKNNRTGTGRSGGSRSGGSGGRGRTPQGINVAGPNGGTEFLDDRDLDAAFANLSPEEQQAAAGRMSTGARRPVANTSKQAKRQAVAANRKKRYGGSSYSKVSLR